MTETSLLEFIAQKIICLTDDVGSLKVAMSDIKAEVAGIKAEVGGIKTEVGGLKTEVAGIKTEVVELQEGQQRLEIEAKKTNNILENDIKPKIEVLFDGYVQNASRLNRVESHIKFKR